MPLYDLSAQNCVPCLHRLLLLDWESIQIISFFGLLSRESGYLLVVLKTCRAEYFFYSIGKTEAVCNSSEL